VPTITKKKEKTKPTSEKKGSGVKLMTVRDFLWLTGFGCLLGLSCPGINQWYLAWIGLAPLVLAIAASKSVWQAGARGLVFGFAYNLVYLNWYLGLQPLEWLGFNWWQGWALAIAAWTITSFHQALIIALFALAAKVVPMTGSFIPQKIPGGWKIPAVIAMPLLWVLIVNKIGNAPSFLGVPWSMLEYTQYKQLPLIQVASIIGGIGVAFIIVMVNTSIASLVSTVSGKPLYKAISASGKWMAVAQCAIVLIAIPLSIALGGWQSAKTAIRAVTPVAVLQGNINIDMQKTVHRYTLDELLERYLRLIPKIPPGLCVFTESAIPTRISDSPEVQKFLGQIAEGRKLDMVVGGIGRDELSNPYNSAYGFSADGAMAPNVYHKRYLVPFGEYCPTLVQYMPEWIKRLTNTPAGGGLSSGRQAEVLKLTNGEVAPLICFECISPELAADSTRKGGQLIVNISDLAWFHKSVVGEQMIAFSVFRAIENRRFFVFAANTGPSAIIDPRGMITERSLIDETTVLAGRVGFSSEISPFTAWFH
jgi:apolipoprotein N-acyltransferase